MRPSRSVQRLRSGLASTLASTMGSTAATVVGMAGLAALVGCQPPPKPAPAPMAPAPVPTADQVRTTQTQFAAMDPKAKVGHVADDDAAGHRAAVAGIAFTDVKVGDVISFTGPDQRPFATGTIVDLDNHTSPAFPLLIVDYQQSASGGRDPKAGDLAIFIPL